MDHTSRILCKLAEFDGFIMYKAGGYDNLIIEAEGVRWAQGPYCMEEFIEQAYHYITAYKISKTIEFKEQSDGK